MLGSPGDKAISKTQGNFTHREGLDDGKFAHYERGQGPTVASLVPHHRKGINLQ